MTIDVSEIIERRGLSPFLIRLAAISWVVTFFDGFDLNVISYAAPYIGTAYHLDKVQLGNVFSAGTFGAMVGGFLFGYVGDRIGRRPAILVATLSFGVLTLGFALVSNYPELVALRFIDGIPIGGMLPLAWALNIEYAPKRFRATIVTLVMIGYSLGSTLGGVVAIWVMPLHGWQSAFLIGGSLSLLSAVPLILFLPESLRFLVAKDGSVQRIAAILRRVAPAEPVPAGARFVIGDEIGERKDFRLSSLFERELRWITPLFWLAYIFSSMTTFFLSYWGPTVLEALGFSRGDAAAASSVNSVMGAVGGLLLMRFTDRKGAIAIAAMPALAVPVMLAAGLLQTGHPIFLVLNALIAVFIVGGHFGMHSIAGIFYPSACRANGAGWATSVAKVGSIIGPIAAGQLLSIGLPTQNIYAVLAICPALTLLCIFLVGRLHSRRIRREQAIEPMDAAAAAASTS